MAPSDTRLRRVPLITAAVLLAATAAFHLTGLSMVAGWVEDDKRSLMALLWTAPAVSWLLIALFWLFQALRWSALEWPVLLMTAAIPLIVAVPLLVLSPAHPGGYMLLASSVLALASHKKQR